MDEYVNRRVEYYGGYLCALQDVAVGCGRSEWPEIKEMVYNLTKAAVHDVILETEKEVKVPNDTA